MQNKVLIAKLLGSGKYNMLPYPADLWEKKENQKNLSAAGWQKANEQLVAAYVEANPEAAYLQKKQEKQKNK